MSSIDTPSGYIPQETLHIHCHPPPSAHPYLSLLPLLIVSLLVHFFSLEILVIQVEADKGLIKHHPCESRENDVMHPTAGRLLWSRRSRDSAELEIAQCMLNAPDACVCALPLEVSRVEPDEECVSVESNLCAGEF